MDYHYNGICLTQQDLLGGYGEEYLESYPAPSLNPEYVSRQTVLADGGDQFGVSTCIFDKYEELVWMGNQGGHVTSYYGPNMQKYTSFQVHATDEIRHLVSLEQGILALTKSALRLQIRRGLPKHTHRSENMIEMMCMLQLSPQTLLIGGNQTNMIEFDLTSMKETVFEGDPTGCVITRGGGGALAACGSPNGHVTLRDVRSPARTKIDLTVCEHTLLDLDLQGDTLVACGLDDPSGSKVTIWDVRNTKRTLDALEMQGAVLLRFLPSVSGRAAALHASNALQLFNVQDPSASTNVFQVDTQATINSFDISATSQAFIFGDQAGHLHLFSPQHNTEPIYNNFSRATVFADPIESYPFGSMRDTSFQFSTIPMPPLAAGEKLFSDLPEWFSQLVYRKPKPIDPDIMKSMKMQGPIGYAPNPRTTKRNQMPYLDSKPNNAAEEANSGSQIIPKKYQKIEMRYSKHSANDSEFELYNKTGFPGLEATLPNSYCNSMLQVLYYMQPIKMALLAHTCAKEFCLSCELGFLFRMLETSSGAPCQASNFLRAFRTVREAAALGLILPHRDTHRDLCGLIQSWTRFILHQMHFEILETRKKEKELAAIAQKESSPPKSGSRMGNPPLVNTSGAENLANNEDDKTLTAVQIEWSDGDDWSWLPPHAQHDTFPPLHTANATSNNGTSEMTPNGENHEQIEIASEPSSDKEETEISELFGITQHQLSSCLKCNKQEERSTVWLGCALQYTGVEGGGLIPPLRSALASRRTTPAWCDSCRRFSPTSQLATVKRLPPILAINCGCITDIEKAHWKPLVSKEQENLEEIAALGNLSAKLKSCRYGTNCTRSGCKFKHPKKKNEKELLPLLEEKRNLPPSEGNTPCLLPNELFIRLKDDGEIIVTEKSDDPKLLELKEEEPEMEKQGQAADYSLQSVIMCIDDTNKNLVAFIKMESDDNDDGYQWFLFNDVSVSEVPEQEARCPCAHYKRVSVCVYAPSRPRPALIRRPIPLPAPATTHQHHAAFTPLGPHETPKRGMLVGMDAEFVTLTSEEVEVRADGRRHTVRPSRLAVARITCVRGEGPLEGVPFIDDYISTQEQVLDYNTKFSGIKPGDLDAAYSSKHLTTLKSTYQKIRFLVDSGVIFVGHGLKNDFRVINLVVPPEQVIDTVQLFHLPHHRMVSLKFLAWHFLGTVIQSETHDSAEDARTALRLRAVWAEFAASGRLRSALARLYRAGEAANWAVPD